MTRSLFSSERTKLTQKEYFPQDIFSNGKPGQYSPRVMIAPHRYIQGVGVLDHLGHYLKIVPSRHPAMLITDGGMKRIGERLLDTLGKTQIIPETLIFGGECSDEEVWRHVAQLQGRHVDGLIVVGGGKCLDAGKCIAHCVSVPAIICPTLASTDAPCSAVSVMYTPEGIFDRPWFFPESPALVVVDTGVIVQAPVRYLVAGMGDAMSTYYEARTCFRNPKAITMVGARPTAAVSAIAELAAKILFENGTDALTTAVKSEVNEAVENVVEANTLLSGMGFESGGLAASHSVAQILPMIPSLHENYLHGEMVAVGLLAHLCLENEESEALRVAGFFSRIGLPVHLGQLSLSIEQNSRLLDEVIGEALKIFFVHNEPFEVTPEKLKRAMLRAYQLGKEVSRDLGEEAFKRLHHPDNDHRS
jgi:glycerol dehydrogenase